ncbi:hypothetical protein AMS68_003331 [Peltaster fructicola]|uniref:Helix-turn-helix domain-containing protein n=1 Tax=Peltaster fructicola TaxID=286661 RepID=A0A6H0XSV0_9PEZI|nr:hypothetical protein AMS68_003331 [Peltaster fructicola]
MGGSASKTSQAAGAAARQYPTRSAQAFNAANASRSNAPQPVAQPGPTVKPPPRASTTRDAGINLDASDPDLARHLRSIGPVQPNPTLSQTSTFNPSSAVPNALRPRTNPALLVLESRAKLQEQADKEFALAGKGGREFLDAYTIRQILMLRDEQKKSAAQIEKSLSLKAGVIDRLGPPGMTGLVTEQGRGRREVDMV